MSSELTISMSELDADSVAPMPVSRTKRARTHDAYKQTKRVRMTTPQKAAIVRNHVTIGNSTKSQLTHPQHSIHEADGVVQYPLLPVIPISRWSNHNCDDEDEELETIDPRPLLPVLPTPRAENLVPVQTPHWLHNQTKVTTLSRSKWARQWKQYHARTKSAFSQDQERDAIYQSCGGDGFWSIPKADRRSFLSSFYNAVKEEGLRLALMERRVNTQVMRMVLDFDMRKGTPERYFKTVETDLKQAMKACVRLFFANESVSITQRQGGEPKFHMHVTTAYTTKAEYVTVCDQIQTWVRDTYGADETRRWDFDPAKTGLRVPLSAKKGRDREKSLYPLPKGATLEEPWSAMLYDPTMNDAELESKRAETLKRLQQSPGFAKVKRILAKSATTGTASTASTEKRTTNPFTPDVRHWILPQCWPTKYKEESLIGRKWHFIANTKEKTHLTMRAPSNLPCPNRAHEKSKPKTFYHYNLLYGTLTHRCEKCQSFNKERGTDDWPVIHKERHSLWRLLTQVEDVDIAGFLLARRFKDIRVTQRDSKQTAMESYMYSAKTKRWQPLTTDGFSCEFDDMREFLVEAFQLAGIKGKFRIGSSARTASVISKLSSNMSNLVTRDSTTGHYKSPFDGRLDNVGYLLPFQNGVLDMRTLTFRDTKREDHITECIPRLYQPLEERLKDATFKKTFELVKNVVKTICKDEESLKHHLWFSAYSMTGLSDHSMGRYIHSKHGGSGKTILMNLLRQMLGPLGVSLSSKTFSSTNSTMHKDLIALLPSYIRAAFLEEMEDEKKNLQYLKRAMGIENLDVDQMYGVAVEIINQVKINMTGNDPFDKSSQLDDAAQRRGWYESMNKKFVKPNELEPMKERFKNDDTVIILPRNEKHKRASMNNPMWADAYMFMLLPYAKRVCNGEQPPRKPCLDFRRHCEQENPLAEWIRKQIETHEGSRISKAKITQVLFSDMNAKFGHYRLLNTFASFGYKYNETARHYSRKQGCFMNCRWRLPRRRFRELPDHALVVCEYNDACEDGEQTDDKRLYDEWENEILKSFPHDGNTYPYTINSDFKNWLNELYTRYPGYVSPIVFCKRGELAYRQEGSKEYPRSVPLKLKSESGLIFNLKRHVLNTNISANDVVRYILLDESPF